MNFSDALLPALIVSILALLTLYLRGMVAAYRAAGDSWKAMDRDVKMVFLLAVPLFRGGIYLLMWIDRLFYTPKSVATATQVVGGSAQSNKKSDAAPM